MSTTTEHFDLIVVEGTDLVNPLTQTNPNWESIDEAMWNNKLGGVILATHLLSGSVHAITLEPQDATVFRFVATADYTVGQTFTVNGQQVTGLTTNGTTLSNKAFVVNQNVLCCLVGTNLTFYVNNNIDEAEDSKKLGGQLPEYYATSEQAQTAISTAQAAQTIAQGAQSTASNAELIANEYSLGMNLLWTNSNPTNSFSPQDINLTITGFDMFIIICRTSTVSGHTTTAFMINEVNSSASAETCGWDGSRTAVHTRGFTLANNAITAGNADRNGVVSNNILIPYKIYGIKYKH